MRRSMVVLTAIVLAAAVCAGGAMAAKKPVKKKPATDGVKGTAMMPGDNGKMDVTYSLRSKGSSAALNFTLKSAEYTVSRLIIGEQATAPKEQEKLLLLKFTVQNPNPNLTHYRFDTIRITAIDSKDTNHESINDVVRSDNNSQSLDINLKPAQKIAVTTGVIVPADVSIPKLMVQLGDPVKVLRYDMHGHIQPLAAPFADPSDKTGAVAKVEVSGEKGVFYPLTYLDLQCEGATLVDGKLNGTDPGENNRLCSVKLTLRNGTLSKRHVRFDTLNSLLYTADKDKIEAQHSLLKATRDEEVDVNLDPGETYTGRVYFIIAKDAKPARIVVADGESRKFSFDISDAK